MADYPISKEAVVMELINLRDRLGGHFAKEVLDMALARLDGFPQMDAVPVVRCRECRHSLPSTYSEGLMHCCYTRKQTMPSGFCHMGKEGGEADG